MGTIMDSRNKFAAMEAMCREKASLAKKETDYWLAEGFAPAEAILGNQFVD
jgi:hypothetical protein